MILACAFGLRIWNIGNVPPGMWFDEALNGIDAWNVWQPGGGFKLVYPDVFPREPMFETLLALAVKIGGAEVVTLRMVSVLVGTLTTLFLYLMLRKEAGEGVALTAAGVLAGLRWHVLFSKLIFRTLMLPLWMILIVWCALEYRRRPALWKAALLGALVGGGFYTYLGWYFMLPVVAGVVLWAVWSKCKKKSDYDYEYERERGKERRGLAAIVVFAGALIVFLPLGLHYLQHPEHLLARPGAVSVFANGWGTGIREIGENAGEALLMLHWRGDHVAVQNIPYAAGLDVFQGIFFIWGIVVCFRRRDALSFILLAWIACGMASTIFTYTDSPNFLRSLVITPAVAAIIAFGLVDGAGRVFRNGPLLRMMAIGVLLIVSAGISGWRVVRWGSRPDVHGKFQTMVVEMGRSARSLAGQDASVLIHGPIYSALPFQFQVLGQENIYPYNDGELPFVFQRPWPVLRSAIGKDRPTLRHIIIPAGPEAEARARAIQPLIRRTMTYRDERTGEGFVVLTVEEAALGRQIGAIDFR